MDKLTLATIIFSIILIILLVIKFLTIKAIFRGLIRQDNPYDCLFEKEAVQIGLQGVQIGESDKDIYLRFFLSDFIISSSSSVSNKILYTNIDRRCETTEKVLDLPKLEYKFNQEDILSKEYLIIKFAST